MDIGKKFITVNIQPDFSSGHLRFEVHPIHLPQLTNLAVANCKVTILRHQILELFADSSRHEDDKKKEEEDEHPKDLDHQPPIGCD